ncbi:AAA family ATPase, partial [Actinosynnema sp. NPDC023658]
MTRGPVQFTPDLLPGDITGVQVYHLGDEEFAF